MVITCKYMSKFIMSIMCNYLIKYVCNVQIHDVQVQIYTQIHSANIKIYTQNPNLPNIEI